MPDGRPAAAAAAARSDRWGCAVTVAASWVRIVAASGVLFRNGGMRWSRGVEPALGRPSPE
jgi:hypothetical protein